MTINAGQLDREIVFQRQGGGSDAFNEPGGDWADIPNSTRWARVKQAPGTEKFASAQNIATAPMLFLVYWDEITSTVGVGDRISYDGGVFNIRWRNEIGRREGVEFAGERDAA